MHTNHRSRSLIWALVGFVLLTGMSCSLFGSGSANPLLEDAQATPPPMPTTEGVTQDNLPLPLTPDAENFSSSQESFSYTTQLSVEEVANFYREALPPQGWTVEQQGDMGGTLMWSISRQDVTYLLVITPSNGMTVVNAGPIK
jgi:hypothetical protein